MRPIAILFANLKGNVGDFAILEAMLRDIGARWPGAPVHLYPHPYLPVDAERLAAFQAASLGVEVVGRAFAASMPAPLRILRRMGAGRAVQAWQIRRLAARSGPEARRFAEYEAVAFAGGDQWNGARLGVSMFGTLGALAAWAPAVHAYPFSINPAVRRFNTAAALRQQFAGLRGPLLVRDSISLGVLESVGVAARLRPDCVFGLMPLAATIPPMPGRDPDRTLLCITGTAAMDGLAANRAALEALGPGAKVELLTTCAPEDGAALRRLGREWGVAVREPLTWQETVAEIRAAGAVATNRLHALILGAMAGGAMVPVADRKKTEAFVRDAGLEHFAPGPRDVTAELMARACAGREDLVERLRAFAARQHGSVESPFGGAQGPGVARMARTGP